MPPRLSLPPGRFENTGAGLEPKSNVENPFAETRRPYQMWGGPTQKGEASKTKNADQAFSRKRARTISQSTAALLHLRWGKRIPCKA